MLVVGLAVPVAWLLGTFPSALLVARAHGRDILQEGSGNPGASNVARLMGWRAGALVLLLDFSKGAIAAGAGMLIGGRPGACALGVAAVVGHTFPLYRKGGKGVAAAGGALVVLYPLIVVGLAVVWFVIARLLHKASLASLLTTILFPVAVAAFRFDVWEIDAVAALALLVIIRHLGNIRRLLRRQEIDLGAPPA
ncbi:MAG: acyl phosphate:glycerol-3-phosphate acyltransferase [Actinomycetota bacterium]|jgi:glycerol-3-phosphate acyltransferase PlsY|nr:acyl phosphate:glycerol-3-phosphate acyltransferase [Actinomycetota bacterium]